MSPILHQLPSGSASVHRLVLDFTGTLSLDGVLLPGVADRLRALSSDLSITVLTADTFGTAREVLRNLPVEVEIIRDGSHKAAVVSGLAPEGVIAIGNGRNDVAMMKVAKVGIAVVGPEGAAAELLATADIVTRDILDALDLAANPLRLKATLRD